MKLALITDTHHGVRGDSVAFADHQKKFFDEVFFPYLVKEEIGTIIHLGDLVDRRKYVSYSTANRLFHDFIKHVVDGKYDFHAILGNHDMTYKNRSDVNALNELYRFAINSLHSDFSIYDRAEEIIFDGLPILFMPWICEDNAEHAQEMIKETKADVMFGHLELKGFEMYRGYVNDHGMDPSVLSRFDLVCSGHYHRKSSGGPIRYLGSPYETTWNDYNDPKGFHIFDTSTRELTFIQNPHVMFMKTFYNDVDGKDASIIHKVNYEQFANKMVKVIVQNKINPLWFEAYIKRIEAEGPIDLQIVDDHKNLDLESDDSIVSSAETTLDVFKRHISALEFPNRPKLERLIVDIYKEAMTIQ